MDNNEYWLRYARERILAKRKGLGLTQDQAAKKTGMNQSAWVRDEKAGKNEKRQQLVAFYRMYDAVELTIHDILPHCNQAI